MTAGHIFWQSQRYLSSDLFASSVLQTHNAYGTGTPDHLHASVERALVSAVRKA
jgi:hypothetical protein